MHLAILGTRGVPPRYGGFETFAAELGTRLVRRGHRVTVYNRSSLYPERPGSWEGVRLVHLPAVRQKYLETVSHALLSSLHALSQDYDVVLLCNAANAFVLPLLRAARFPVAINVDGIERMRRKWSVAGRLVYHAGEALSSERSSRVVADAEVIAEYYRRAFAVDPSVIPYGAQFPDEPDSDVLARLGLAPRSYVLYVSRFEPENHPLEVARAFERVRAPIPLVMVGDAPYAHDLVRAVAAVPDPRILRPGALYGRDYRTLQRNALVYVQATEVGGTHPALIEAMGSGGAVLALETPENREVGADAVVYFRLEGEHALHRELQRVLDEPARLEPLRERARARVSERYHWDRVVDRYEALFEELGGGVARGNSAGPDPVIRSARP